MKVKELIEKLQTMPKCAEVVLSSIVDDFECPFRFNCVTFEKDIGLVSRGVTGKRRVHKSYVLLSDYYD